MTNSTTISWQTALKNIITDPQELITELQLEQHADHLMAPHASLSFALRVPRSFVARMQKGDPHDPLLRQVLPIAEELQVTPGYSFDALGEKNANPVPGLLHKYHGRVLILLAGSCAVNCRFCFRRHFPYTEHQLDKTTWQSILNYIRADKSIREVIYSGGDPLVCKDKHLAELTADIAQIPQITRLRIHTRLPIVIPERVTDELVHWLTKSHLQPTVVLHANHGNEINDEVKSAVQTLRQARITVLNQSTLLKGVNDTVESLVTLSEKLFTAGILPYYLNTLDKVQGTAHFAVPETQARFLHTELLAQLPGYLVPKLVKEKAGALYKLPL